MNFTEKSKPLIAVGVPVYNGEKYLHECLESILNQTYRNWECVISENCSNDNSLKIAESFIERDKRFKIYKCPVFVDLVENWNNTFIYSNLDAKYFKMVQADDWIFEEYFERMVDIFEENVDIGLTTSYRIDDKNVLPKNYDIYDGIIKNGHDILHKQLTKQIDYMGTITTVMFRSGLFKELSNYPKIFDESSYHIDMEIVYQIMSKSNIGFVPKILSYTRRHKESGTTTTVKRYRTIFQHDEKVYFDYLNQFPDLKIWYKRLRLKYASFHLSNIIFRKKKALQWHRKYLIRPFTLKEYIIGTFYYNKISSITDKLISKILLYIFKN